MEARTRWSILLAALVCTLVAMAYPAEEQDTVVEVAVPSELRQPQIDRPSEAVLPTERDWIASDEDPFAARAWQAPPLSAPEPDKPVAAAPIVVSAPPPPPPLPFKFVGQMNNGADRTVYLARGDQVVLAHQGDVLDGNYKVLAIRANQIDFESISSGLKQTLAIPAQEN